MGSKTSGRPSKYGRFRSNQFFRAAGQYYEALFPEANQSAFSSSPLFSPNQSRDRDETHVADHEAAQDC
jgi:hypothetical protein